MQAIWYCSLTWVGALVVYQEHACPLLEPLFGCHGFVVFHLSQLGFENHGWCRSCGLEGAGSDAAVILAPAFTSSTGQLRVD